MLTGAGNPGKGARPRRLAHRTQVHTSAYVSIRQHTSAFGKGARLCRLAHRAHARP